MNAASWSGLIYSLPRRPRVSPFSNSLAVAAIAFSIAVAGGVPSVGILAGLYAGMLAAVSAGLAHGTWCALAERWRRPSPR